MSIPPPLEPPLNYERRAPRQLDRYAPFAWIVFSLMTIAAIGVAWGAPRMNQKVLEIAMDFNIKLPTALRLYYLIPNFLYVLIGMLFFIVGLTATILLPSKRTALKLNASSLLLLCLLIVAVFVVNMVTGSGLIQGVNASAPPPASKPTAPPQGQ